MCGGSTGQLPCEVIGGKWLHFLVGKPKKQPGSADEDVGASEDPRAAAHWGPCKLRFRWGFFSFREVFPLISLSAAIGLAGDGVSTTGSSAQYTSPALS